MSRGLGDVYKRQLLESDVLRQKEDTVALLHPSSGDLGGRLFESVVQARAQQLLSRVCGSASEPEPYQAKGHYGDSQ